MMMKFSDKKNKITLLVPTNVGLYAPSVKLIKKTLESARDKLLSDREVKVIVHCDLWDDSSESDQYLKNLRKLSSLYGFELLFGSRGLSCATREMISRVDTEYYFFLEHDWVFEKKIDLDEIVRMMDANKNVKYIRFNKRKNKIAGGDSILEPRCIDGVNLLANDNWSANPHIARVSVFKDDWMEYIPSKPERGNLMEIFIRNAYIDDINNYGFNKALKQWGVFVYGDIEEGRSVRHLDGSRSLLKKAKKSFNKFTNLWQ